jgi:hypothetical protein
MSTYRRANAKGATCFFTVITYPRRKILTLPENRHALRNAIAAAKQTGGITHHLTFTFDISMAAGLRSRELVIGVSFVYNFQSVP